MFRALIRDRFLLLLLLLVILLRLFAFMPSWVERYYTAGVYPPVSRFFRSLFGWIPFSAGDVLYILALAWLAAKGWKAVQLIRRRQLRAHLSWALLRKYLTVALAVYVYFVVSWGLNYYREGIPGQLGLKVEPYSVQELFDLTLVLQQRLNKYAESVDSVERLRYNSNDVLFRQAIAAYSGVEKECPFLHYNHPSIKPSLFTTVGEFIGFTGYYNPFTGEAQLKTDIPVFLKPFVVTHEIGHQLGYAKENEASFVAYLTCKSSPDLHFLYSAYFEIYRDAITECRHTPNKELTKRIRANIHPRVRYDAFELQAYLLRNQNFVEPMMTGIYDRYLKLNNQPKGTATYNEVVAYLVAYMKKYGKEAI